MITLQVAQVPHYGIASHTIEVPTLEDLFPLLNDIDPQYGTVELNQRAVTEFLKCQPTTRWAAILHKIMDGEEKLCWYQANRSAGSGECTPRLAAAWKAWKGKT